MPKIICLKATMYSIREDCKDATALICKPGCPICKGEGYTKAGVVEAKNLKSLKSHIEGMRLPNEHSANALITVITEKIECILKGADREE